MDATGWHEHYAAANLVWSAGPNRTVAEQVADLDLRHGARPRRGEGRNALWLAEQCGTVAAVDFSAVGPAKARAAAERRGVPLSTVVAELTAYEPGDTFDLVLLAYLPLPWPQLAVVLGMATRAVAPGGTFLLVAHDLENLTRGVGGPQDPRPTDTGTGRRSSARPADRARGAGSAARRGRRRDPRRHRHVGARRAA